MLRAAGRGFALMAAAGALTLACAREAAPPGPPAGEVGPQQILENFTLRNTSTKGLLWVLEADSGLSFGQGEPTRLRNMRVRFFDGAESVRSVLTSKRGEVQEATQSMYATDSVVVGTPAGETLRTEALRWDPRNEKISTDVFFRLTRGRDVMTGVGLEADPDLSRYTVRREVRAEVRDDEGQVREGLDGGTSRER